MYSALEIAKYVVNKCTVDRHPISNLQLQKILYYIQRSFDQKERLTFLTSEKDDPNRSFFSFAPYPVQDSFLNKMEDNFYGK